MTHMTDFKGQVILNINAGFQGVSILLCKKRKKCLPGERVWTFKAHNSADALEYLLKIDEKLDFHHFLVYT